MHTRKLSGGSQEALQEAAELLQSGEAVAFPTDTVYGLGAHALDADAVQKIYEAKGRPSDKPLIILIHERAQLDSVASYIPEEAEKLIAAFWPGPLTLVFRKQPGVIPDYVTRGLETVAVRMPNHPVALQLISESGCLIAAPSANTSGKPSPTEASHVALDMDGKIPMILDGGAGGIGSESTLVEFDVVEPNGAGCGRGLGC